MNVSRSDAAVRRALDAWSITLLLLLAIPDREVAPGSGARVAEQKDPIVRVGVEARSIDACVTSGG